MRSDSASAAPSVYPSKAELDAYHGRVNKNDVADDRDFPFLPMLALLLKDPIKESGATPRRRYLVVDPLGTPSGPGNHLELSFAAFEPRLVDRWYHWKACVMPLSPNGVCEVSALVGKHVHLVSNEIRPTALVGLADNCMWTRLYNIKRQNAASLQRRVATSQAAGHSLQPDQCLPKVPSTHLRFRNA